MSQNIKGDVQDPEVKQTKISSVHQAWRTLKEELVNWWGISLSAEIMPLLGTEAKVIHAISFYQKIQQTKLSEYFLPVSTKKKKSHLPHALFYPAMELPRWEEANLQFPWEGHLPTRSAPDRTMSRAPLGRKQL